MAKFYKTAFTIEVLSEDEFGECLTLSQIAWAIDEGPCVGRMSCAEATEISPKLMAYTLHEFGSDPSFFMLDDAGNKVED